MSFDVLVLEIKKLNLNCDIKISGNRELYISVNPETLVLPEGIRLSLNNGNYTLSGESLSKISLKPLHTFLLNEKDYFPETVFSKVGYDNIYELTSKNAKSLILDYLRIISEIDITSRLAIAVGSSSENIIKAFCYAGLKKEDKFSNVNINNQAREQLYQYVKKIPNPDVYKEPSKIQNGWDSFQSWHTTGGLNQMKKRLLRIVSI